MKNKSLIYSSLICGLSFAACDMDVVPPADISAENFWKTEKDAWYGLTTCYETLSGYDIWDEMCTDNAHSHKPWEGNFESVQQNGISGSATYGSYNFSGVRKANLFIQNVDNCEMSDELRTRMKAEARFFRAMEYLELTTKFGKVPVITEVLAYDAPNVARDEVSTVRAFILDELAEIATILPESYSGGYLNESGRITRYGALALRARAALYFGDYTQAEASARAVINSGKYALHRLSSLNAAQQKEADEMEAYIDFDQYGIDKEKYLLGIFSYESIWHDSYANPSNAEYVVTREYTEAPNCYDWARYTYSIPTSFSIYQGYCSYEPMQDLVDAYWDLDGKTLRNDITVEQRKNRYETMWEDFKGLSQQEFTAKVPETDLMQYEYMKEFRNRDSRLYASIMFPFKGMHQSAKGTFYSQWEPANINKNGNESWSGYFMRKMVTLNPYDLFYAAEDYPTIRYAEVLLTFAEARLYNSGWDSEVQGALNEIRDRCGMPAVPASLSKEEAIAFLRNERRIELALEGHRFDDIRRYGSQYCKEYMNGASYAPNGYIVINKQWDDRLLLMPIPQGAIDLNPLLEGDQNPGY